MWAGRDSGANAALLEAARNVLEAKRARGSGGVRAFHFAAQPSNLRLTRPPRGSGSSVKKL